MHVEGIQNKKREVVFQVPYYLSKFPQINAIEKKIPRGVYVYTRINSTKEIEGLRQSVYRQVAPKLSHL